MPHRPYPRKDKYALSRDEINIVISAPLGYGASSVQVAIYNMLKEAGVNVKMKRARFLVPHYRGKKIETLVPVHIVRFP